MWLPQPADYDNHPRRDDHGGCTATDSVLATGVAEGTTTLAHRYCYRSAPPNCGPENRNPNPVRVTIVVTK